MSQLEPSLQEWLSGVRDDVATKLADPKTSQEDLALAFGDFGQVLHAFDLRNSAVQAYGVAATLQPKEFRWPYFSGRIKEFLGELDGAENDLQTALQIDAGIAHAWIRLGDVQRANNKPEEAIDSYRRSLRLTNSAAAHFGLGQAQLALERNDEAIHSFRDALVLQPAASAVRGPLAQALRAAGQVQEADRELRRRGRQSIVLNDPTSKILSEVRTLGSYQALFSMAASSDLSPEELLGFTLTQFGDVEGTEDVIVRDLNRLEQANEESSIHQRARLHYSLGGLRVYLDQDERAAGNFLRALQLDPEMIDADLKLGNLLARRGAYRNAVVRYDRVLTVRPDDLDARLKRGTALLNLRQARPAIEDFTRALELDPGAAVAHVRLAELADATGNSQRAERLFQRALEEPALDPRGAALVGRGYADFLVRHQRFEEGIRALQSTLEQDRTLTSARLRLADLLAHLQRYDEALVEFDQVVADQPSNPTAHLHRAAVLLLTEQWLEAIEALEVAVDLVPHNRKLEHQLARVLAANPQERDPARALSLILPLHEETPTPATAVTMSLALAAQERFEDALALERELNPAPTQQRRLARYQNNQPYITDNPAELIVQ